MVERACKSWHDQATFLATSHIQIMDHSQNDLNTIEYIFQNISNQFHKSKVNVNDNLDFHRWKKSNTTFLIGTDHWEILPI